MRARLRRARPPLRRRPDAGRPQGRAGRAEPRRHGHQDVRADEGAALHRGRAARARRRHERSTCAPRRPSRRGRACAAPARCAGSAREARRAVDVAGRAVPSPAPAAAAVGDPHTSPGRDQARSSPPSTPRQPRHRGRGMSVLCATSPGRAHRQVLPDVRAEPHRAALRRMQRGDRIRMEVLRHLRSLGPMMRVPVPARAPPSARCSRFGGSHRSRYRRAPARSPPPPRSQRVDAERAVAGEDARARGPLAPHLRAPRGRHRHGAALRARLSRPGHRREELAQRLHRPRREPRRARRDDQGASPTSRARSSSRSTSAAGRRCGRRSTTSRRRRAIPSKSGNREVQAIIAFLAQQFPRAEGRDFARRLLAGVESEREKFYHAWWIEQQRARTPGSPRPTRSGSAPGAPPCSAT